MNNTPVIIPDYDDDSVSPCFPHNDSAFPQHSFDDSYRMRLISNNVDLRRDREREGRCAECGAQTHDFQIDPMTGSKTKVPLTIEREVFRGRCLLCHPIGVSNTTPTFQMPPFDSSMNSNGSLNTPRQTVTCLENPHNDVRQEVVFKFDTRDDIVDVLYAMKSCRLIEAIQESCCEALWVHSWDDEVAAAIGRIGGIQEILAAMSQFPQNSRLQRCACEALQNLALNNYNRSTIVENGGVSLIVQAMLLHLESRVIQQCCCTAMASLTASQELHADIVRAGGAHAVLHAARKHPTDDCIRYGVSQTLQSLGCNLDRRVSLVL